MPAIAIADWDASIRRNALPAYGKPDEPPCKGGKKPAHVQAVVQAFDYRQIGRQVASAG